MTRKTEAYYTAGQFALIRARFLRKPVALIGGFMIVLFFLCGFFASFLSPTSPTSAGADLYYIKGAPQWVRFYNDADEWVGPHRCVIKQELDMETLSRVSVEDCSTPNRLRWFVRGWEYHFVDMPLPFTNARLRLGESDWHLFGMEEGQIHIFGTDKGGKDIFSRTLHAIWISLSIALVALVVKLFMSLLVGGTAGFFGGWVDSILMALTDAIRAIPAIPMYLAIAVALPRDWSSEQRYMAIAFVIGFLDFGALGRRLRTHLLTERSQDYVLAAKLSGASPRRVIFKHLVPSFTSYIIIDTIINLPYQILAETSLSFLGLGLSEPVNSLGSLLQGAQDVEVLQSLQWQLIPAVVFILIVLSFVLVGDGLRDAADPYQERKS